MKEFIKNLLFMAQFTIYQCIKGFLHRSFACEKPQDTAKGSGQGKLGGEDEISNVQHQWR